MRKVIFVLSMLMCCAIAAVAMPAKPGWHTITQSDGTTLKVQAVGNAFNNAILTSDGLTVARGADGDFYYISSLTGLTTMRAHEVDQRTPAEMAFVNAQRANMTMQTRSFLQPRKEGMLRVGGSNADSGVPAQGQRRIPIVLVEFKDKKFSNTREEVIEAMLTGDSSVGQYFRDQSNGLYEPEFDVYGIYGLSQNREYYGGNSGGNDKGLGWMVTEACQLAAAHGVSFKPYDTNNDDYCDVVIVIYAGVGEAQASWNHPEAIWPCNWYLSSASYYGMGGNGAFRPNNNDPVVDMFAVFNELHGSDDNGKTIDGIGTFAHEFGHCLGLPDFYDTGNSNHYGMGDWDIMCMGCYNNDGFTPPGYTAYEKVFMGWVNYITARPGTYYTLPVWNQKSASTDKAVCIKSDLNENEFFVLENRKKQGWDRYLPGEGIFITHITYNEDRWWGNTPNNEDIQLMTFVPADNSLSYNNESTDLWPQNGKTAFTDSSTPPARLYMAANGNITGNAGYLGKPVTEMVINNNGTASFWFMKGAATDPVISVSSDEINFGNVMMNNSATMTFNVVGQALTGDVNLAVNDPNGVFTVNPTTISTVDAINGYDVTVTFAPAAISDYNATLTLQSAGAEDVTITLKGHGLIEGYAPVMLPADENAINLTQFRADWTDQSPAQNVTSYTLEVMTKPAFSLLESADFSSIPDAVSGNYLDDISENYSEYLPEGWSGTYFIGAYGSTVILAFGGKLQSPTYDFTGYDKASVVVKASTYNSESTTVTVSTSKGSQVLTLDGNETAYTVVLDCAAEDDVTFTSDAEDVCRIKQVDVYAGDMTAATYNATETGGPAYRLITDITDKFYTVRDLEAEGTYIYKVKSLFSDGTESAWSNIQEVTLFDNGPAPHGYELGDVDHDGKVAITDVTVLIDWLLSDGGIECCPICADVDGSQSVSISDVTELIDLLLSGNK